MSMIQSVTTLFLFRASWRFPAHDPLGHLEEITSPSPHPLQQSSATRGSLSVHWLVHQPEHARQDQDRKYHQANHEVEQLHPAASFIGTRLRIQFACEPVHNGEGRVPLFDVNALRASLAHQLLPGQVLHGHGVARRHAQAVPKLPSFLAPA
jgi:hypothetical protein